MGLTFALIAACCLFAAAAPAAGPDPGAMALRDGWVRERFEAGAGRLPFSFTVGGRPWLAAGSWRERRSTASAGRGRTRHTLTYRDPAGGLEARCELVTCSDFPTVEWTVRLRNTGKSDTPPIADLQALDALFRGPADGDFLLHHAVGSPCQPNDYQPLETPLPPGAIKRISAAGGRSTNSDLCYFNVDWAEGGVIVALGWPGQWAAEFRRDGRDGLTVRAGQETLRTTLHPGEEIRSPLVALQFRQGGDWLEAQNVWRRWMVAHNLPRPGGRPIPTHYAGCFGNPLPRADEEIAQAEAFARDGVKLDYWFIDAGWYPCAGSWTNTGTWEPDPARFPQGLKPVGDALHRQGIRFIVWFEPERVAAGSWLAENRPEWVLGGKAGGLLNMGDPAARRWITERVDAIVSQSGIDVYRGDYNLDPLAYWQGADAPDRQGMTENAYVTGFLAFWDELLRRHPGLYIDTCASGGRRNDLETLRRSAPLLRSDWAVVAFNAAGAPGQQAQTHGISLWIPYHGSGSPSGDPYVMRSSYSPAFRMGWDGADPKRDPAMLRRTVAEFRRIAPMMLGDFWPLTPWNLSASDWIGWQYDRPEKGAGAIQLFRRPECAEESLTVRLRGLAPDATYTLEDLDGAPARRLTGRALMEGGLTVTVRARPGSAALLYRRAAD